MKMEAKIWPTTSSAWVGRVTFGRRVIFETRAHPNVAGVAEEIAEWDRSERSRAARVVGTLMTGTKGEAR